MKQSKTCLLCGCTDESGLEPTCLLCGEATWKLLAPRLVFTPQVVVEPDQEPADEPAAMPELVAQPVKRGPGRPRKPS